MILLIIFALTSLSLNAQPTTSNDFESIDLDYFSPKTNCNISFGSAEDNLLVEMHIIDIQNSGLYEILSKDTTLKQSILYWLHLRLFQLIDSSFLYDVNKYTSNLWNEYCLYLLSISNNYKTMTLIVNISISQIEIEQIINAQLQKNGEEIAAYIRFKLSDFINNYYTKMTINDLYVDLMLFYPITTQHSLITYNKTSNKTMYILIIGVCMIIIGLITVSLCVYKRVQKSIKDIKSLMFIGYKIKKQNHDHESIKKHISLKSLSDGSKTITNITDITNITNQTDNNINRSPDIPIMDNNIFNDPLPSIMQQGPSSDSLVSNIITLPPKRKSKSSIEISLKYDYNGNVVNVVNVANMSLPSSDIKQMNFKKRKRTTTLTTDQQDLDSIDIIHEQKESIISYDDNEKIATFKIISDDELGDSLFNDVVTD